MLSRPITPRGRHRHLGGPASAAAARDEGGHLVGQGVARAHHRLPDARPDRHRRRQAHHLPGDGQGRRRLRHRQPGAHACRPSRTRLPLVGAEGLQVLQRQAPSDRAEATAGRAAVLDHLLHRYGSMLAELVELVEADPSLAQPARARAGVPAGRDRLRRDARGRAAPRRRPDAPHPAQLRAGATAGSGPSRRSPTSSAPLLGWDDARRGREVAAYTARAEAEARRGAPARRREAVAGPAARPRPRAACSARSPAPL